jgi:tyrosyl-tRNA synthetase
MRVFLPFSMLRRSLHTVSAFRIPVGYALSKNSIHSVRSQHCRYKWRSSKVASSGKYDVADCNAVFAKLEERGLLSAVAGPRDGLNHLLSTRKAAAYCGVEPTAPSMHVGNLLPLMVLFWLYLYGHPAYTLVGGATAEIGDPSWRETARENKATSEHEFNASSIQQQMLDLWDSVDRFADLNATPAFSRSRKRGQLNNADWLQNLRFLDIMGSLGKDLKISVLLAKDSMKSRLWAGQANSNNTGLSLSELTYSALQSWDFWHLYQEKDVQLQIGGGDQYGNITTGVDAVQYMIRTHRGAHAEANELERSYGVTAPLVTIGSGPNAKKMGKSSGNAVWLSPKLTSNFELYQYFMRLPDEDVRKIWKMYTFRPVREIEDAMVQHDRAPEQRSAHHSLAHDFVSLHRGQEAADLAQQQHKMLFLSKSSSYAGTTTLPSNETTDLGSVGTTALGLPVASDVGSVSLQVANTDLAAASTPPTTPYPASLAFRRSVADILVDLDVCQSKAEVKRMLSAQGGLYCGPRFEPITSQYLHFRPHSPIISADYSADGIPLAAGNLLMLRRGKWKIKVVHVIPDADYDTLGDENWSRAWKARKTSVPT